MPDVHKGGMRLEHIQVPDRGVHVPGRELVEGPIEWGLLERVEGGREREGRGKSGLRYVVRRGREWSVCVCGTRSDVQVGSARLQDHALALAQMWEQAVLSGRVDMS